MTMNTTEYERATIMGTYQMYTSGGVGGDYRGVQVNASGQIVVDISSYVKIEGGESIIKSRDDIVQDLLTDILKELKIMNLHLTIVTDNEITKEELE